MTAISLAFNLGTHGEELNTFIFHINYCEYCFGVHLHRFSDVYHVYYSFYENKILRSSTPVQKYTVLYSNKFEYVFVFIYSV